MGKTISARQLSLIAFISSFSLKLTILPSLLFEKVGIDGIFLIAISLLFDFIEFFLVYFLLKNNKNVDFSTFLEKTFGKIIAKIVFVLFLVFYFFKYIALIIGGFDYARYAIFKEAPLFLFLFIMLASSNSLVLFKSKSYGRTVEFFYPIISFVFLLFMLISVLTASLQDIRPLLTTDISNFFGTLFYSSIIGGNYLFMLFFMGKVKFGKNTQKTLVFNILFSIFLVLLFYTINYSAFRNTAAFHPHAISEIIQFIPLPSILGNFSWFAVSLMLLLFLLQSGLFCGCLAYSLEKIVYIGKEKKDWITKFSIFLIDAFVFVFVYYIFRSFEELKVFMIDKIYIPILCCVLFLLPVIISIVQVIQNIKKRRKNEKTF